MLNQKITSKLRAFFYKKKASRSLVSVISNKVIEVNQNLDAKQKAIYLVKDNRLMTSKEQKNFSIRYKVQKWFLKELGQVVYQDFHTKTTYLFIDFLKIHTSKKALETQIGDLALAEKVYTAIVKYLQKKKRSEVAFKFMFATKDPWGIKFINSLCNVCSLKKEFLTYTCVNPTSQKVSKILELLDTYVLNNLAEYRVVEKKL